MPHKQDYLTGPGHWHQAERIEGYGYRCGYCGRDVAPTTGWQTDQHNVSTIRICPHCNCPTFFSAGWRSEQFPGPLIAVPIGHLPEDIAALYKEARSSVAARAYSGAVMLCRKVLMHVAVEGGAETGQTFLAYVEWLIDNQYAPKSAQAWVDYIRSRGNEANHEIVVMTDKDAGPVVLFTEALLRNVYELPKLVPNVPEEKTGPANRASNL